MVIPFFMTRICQNFVYLCKFMRNILLMRRIFIIAVCFLMLSGVSARAQFLDSSTGLLQMVSADMNESGTFMITNNYVNEHSLPSSGWRYDTFSYGFSITFWSRLELGYVLTIFNGDWDPYAETYREKIIKNQDRHFLGRFQLLKEGEFGWKWMPSVVVGMSDPATGSGGYTDPDAVDGSGNGYFNRTYIAATKHFSTPLGEVGTHLAYIYNKRADYPLNGPCAAINWKPVWLKDLWLLDDVNLIAEYDSRTFNVGMVASVWDNRFEAMFELQNLKWINFGLRYKLRIK